jgi:hypothetical protein
MEEVRLIRLSTGDEGTFGKIQAKGKTWISGELPWRENAPETSCIPPGRYKGEWTWSPRLKRKLYTIFPVSHRAGIRIHSANLMGDRNRGFVSQLRGCIAVGKKLGVMDGQRCILLSVVALRELESVLDYKPFMLTVEERYRERS